MALPSRYTTFVNGDTLSAAELNGELDILQQLLSGNANGNVHLAYDTSDIPNLVLDNTGAGVLFEAKQSGTVRVRINAGGTIKSFVGAGSPPIDAVSTDLCTNLNADLLDGYEATDFVLVGADYVEDSNEVEIDGDDTTSVDVYIKAKALTDEASLHLGQGTKAAVGNWRVLRKDSGATLDIQHHTGGGYSSKLKIDVGTGKLLYNSKRVPVYSERIHWQWAQHFVTPSAGVHGSGPEYIYTADANYPQIDIEKVYYRFGSTGVGGDSTYYLKVYDATGTEVASRTITIGGSDTAGTTYSVDITDIALTTLGYAMDFVCGTAGKHKSVTLTAAGNRQLGVA